MPAARRDPGVARRESGQTSLTNDFLGKLSKPKMLHLTRQRWASRLNVTASTRHPEQPRNCHEALQHRGVELPEFDINLTVGGQT